MQIEYITNETEILLIINGEVDASSSIILDDEFSKAVGSGIKQILIDCTHLSYISSAGLGVFMAHIEDCEVSNVKFVLFGMSSKILSVFNMLGLDQLIPITATKEEALNHLNG